MNRNLVGLLAAATGTATLLTLAAVPGTAVDGPAPPSPQRPGPIAESDLVPGIADTPDGGPPKDTPDQAQAPDMTARAEEEPPPGRAPDPEGDALVEYVPPAEVLQGAPGGAVAPASAPMAPQACSTSTGPYQRQVERYLKLKVDGKQSPEDCKVIRAFQEKHGIIPANGFTGPVTGGVVRLAEAKANPNAEKRCPVPRMRKKGEHWAPRVACVDLARQIMWVQNHDEVIFGPAPVRTGRKGYPTRTGTHRVYWKHRDHFSTIYHSPMPFSQFFDGGQAFHGITANIYSPPGSYGCVNLRKRHAEKLWNMLRNGDSVFVWGKKPGT
ncbi:L,D-transpeptidase family protein [Streptomyces violens]|uniref:L,D-transpeptidase family protein n=1 Tax=Streptomyces violens TaxID=66377 RepID=UPI0004C1D73F|nr:L,D-transpeptidase family protein [Streptomyces violens]